MLYELLLAILVGVLIGIFTGLTPGIHINLVSIIVVSIAPFLLQYVSLLFIGIFIISMSITHTFLDAVPGIYLGAPDADQALNVLPGHRLLLRGKGHQAVLCTVIGSLLVLLLSLLLFPLFLLLMKITYPVIRDWTGLLLVAVMAYLILKEKSWNKKALALAMFLLAGSLGLCVLNILTLQQPLFPLLSGLFGFSILLLSLHQSSSIPVQAFDAPLTVSSKKALIATTAASWMGFLAAFLPGFGSSQAAIVAMQVVGDLGDEGFLVLVGGINTANMLISIGTVYILDKARNGAIVAILQLFGEVSFVTMLVFLACALVAGGMAALLTISVSRGFALLVPKLKYKAIVLSILGFITALTFYFDGFVGLLVLATSTALGLFAGLKGVGKNHLMGCLILPVILYFLL